MTELLLLIALWSGSGILACIIFRRHGHNLLLFAGLAVWMGPLVIYMMLYVARQEEPMVVDVVQDGAPGAGWLDVLVGTDGSTESVTSVSAALTTLKPALGRVTITSVLDAETAHSPHVFSTDEEAEQAVRDIARRADLDGAALVLLSGRADRALSAYAQSERFDAILVGHESHRLAGALLGSTIRRLASDAPVPVIIGPPAESTRTMEVADVG